MEGINNFIRELQQFNIDISNRITVYNGFRSSKLFAVFMQNAYLKFNTELYAHLKRTPDKDARITYLKKLKIKLTELDEILQQNRDMFALLQSLITDNAINNYEKILPKLKKMHVAINTEGFTAKQLEDIDLLSFIDIQIKYSYKAISLAYNMITLELGVPSSYGTEPGKPIYKLQWRGSMPQLAELFVELQRKGWIATIEESKIEAAVENIINLFDIRRSRIPEQEQEYTPMSEILKGALDRTGTRQYEHIYKDNYNPVFNGIKSLGKV